MKKLIKKTIKEFFIKFFFPKIYETSNTAAPIKFSTFFYQKILGINRKAYWPVHFTSKVSGVENILIGIGTAPGLSPGCYIQGIGKIYIGDYTIIAPNVGIISANHNIHDYRKHEKSIVKIGKYCWIGMNSVILPGVTLGDHTIVAAGSVVTKSFPDGYCVIGGTPAKILKKLNPNKCIKYKNTYEYYGYIPKNKFKKFALKHLNFTEEEIDKWIRQD
jgi:acetyltransferase-like isoleucine patch superfamily enzyme